MSIQDHAVMYLEHVEQTVNEAIEELGLGHSSVRRLRMHEDYVSLEFAAFADDESVIQIVSEHFTDLCRRVRWQWCRVVPEGANRIVVTMTPSKPKITMITPPLPRLQPMFVD